MMTQNKTIKSFAVECQYITNEQLKREPIFFDIFVYNLCQYLIEKRWLDDRKGFENMIVYNWQADVQGRTDNQRDWGHSLPFATW